ncbi:uncharacterized protein LOC113865749 [Abrus precatorius]|uniref:Uncharacterized protein LOC113865749 n=1 Tax=Abrus precatorius TaxID=3816 RepID=A0A8B8LJW6_ABRPR|nr:uncharacterized protein LOC113865749 [Abrus precatorius]
MPMASSSSTPNSKKVLGFMANAMKQKHSFIQLFAMTGIMLLSMRSLGQKYRIHGLEEDIHALRLEHGSLVDRVKHIKSDLLREASHDPTGLFAARLRALFSQQY